MPSQKPPTSRAIHKPPPTNHGDGGGGGGGGGSDSSFMETDVEGDKCVSWKWINVASRSKSINPETIAIIIYPLDKQMCASDSRLARLIYHAV